MKKYFCFWGGVALSAALLFLPAGQAEAKQASRGAAAELAQLVHSQTLPRVTLVWEPVPDAVSYEIELFYGSEYKEKNVFLRQREIYTNGVELLQVPRGREGAGTVHWRVQGLDLDGNPVGGPTTPCSLTAGLFEMTAPLTTGEMEEMDYAPLYPAYAWIPRAGAAKYEVEVLREENGLSRHLRYLYSDSHDVYDEEPLNRGGVYSWRVRALDERERPVSQWSEKRKLEITAPVQVAALGDSITHGGGAASVPPVPP